MRYLIPVVSLLDYLEERLAADEPSDTAAEGRRKFAAWWRQSDVKLTVKLDASSGKTACSIYLRSGAQAAVFWPNKTLSRYLAPIIYARRQFEDGTWEWLAGCSLISQTKWKQTRNNILEHLSSDTAASLATFRNATRGMGLACTPHGDLISVIQVLDDRRLMFSRVHPSKIQVDAPWERVEKWLQAIGADRGVPPASDTDVIAALTAGAETSRPGPLRPLPTSAPVEQVTAGASMDSAPSCLACEFVVLRKHARAPSAPNPEVFTSAIKEPVSPTLHDAIRSAYFGLEALEMQTRSAGQEAQIEIARQRYARGHNVELPDEISYPKVKVIRVSLADGPAPLFMVVPSDFRAWCMAREVARSVSVRHPQQLYTWESATAPRIYDNLHRNLLDTFDDLWVGHTAGADCLFVVTRPNAPASKRYTALIALRSSTVATSPNFLQVTAAEMADWKDISKINESPTGDRFTLASLVDRAGEEEVGIRPHESGWRVRYTGTVINSDLQVCVQTVATRSITSDRELADMVVHMKNAPDAKRERKLLLPVMLTPESIDAMLGDAGSAVRYVDDDIEPDPALKEISPAGWCAESAWTMRWVRDALFGPASSPKTEAPRPGRKKQARRP